MTSFDDLFFPKSIAIIGASANILSFGSAFFTTALDELGYEGKRYYINPKYEGQLIFGQKIIRSLDEVTEKIDVVYSCIRASLVPDLVRQCVKRGDKFIVVFTSGFSEILTDEAIEHEKELLSIIKGSPTRIIGPNCLGPYNPSSKIGWSTGSSAPAKQGNVAFASQSGGHATTLLRIAPGRGFYYSKGLSFGNQIDLNCVEILEYYAADPQTEVIALYLEDTGSADGSAFFKKLQEVTKSKPVIIWKGGQTQTGARAAASHTGAISGSFNIWKAMTKQAGGIFVTQSEEFFDMIHLLSVLVPHKRMQRCKNLGLIIPGGGNCVEGTDVFTKYGFKVPLLSQETQEKIATLIPAVNTSVKNPVDLGASGTLDKVFLNSIKYISEDPNIDVIIHYQPIDWIAQAEIEFGGGSYGFSLAKSLGRLAKKLEKPIIQLTPLFQVETRIAEIYPKFIEILRAKGIPNFTSMVRLAVALNYLNDYMVYLESSDE
ncbi:MAG TPA: CoA-binding protein [Candidatus Deferrimicrobium sp.]|nr:CoA-binding protein [Candidatus Deferrimicrobium sp.]